MNCYLVQVTCSLYQAPSSQQHKPLMLKHFSAALPALLKPTQRLSTNVWVMVFSISIISFRVSLLLDLACSLTASCIQVLCIGLLQSELSSGSGGKWLHSGIIETGCMHLFNHQLR